MTESLQNLWQSQAVEIDSTQLIQGIEDNLALQRRLNAVNYVLTALCFIVVAAVDLQIGLLGVRGLGAGVVAVGAIVKVWSAERAIRKQPAVAEMDSTELLRLGIKQTKSAILQARLLYAVYPVSLVSGFMFGRFLPGDSTVSIKGADLIVWLGGPILALSVLAAVMFGVRIAQKKVMELQELSKRLRELEDEV